MYFKKPYFREPLTEPKKDALVLMLGFLMPFTFSPYNQWWLSFPVLSAFFYLCLYCSPQRAMLRGWLFGFSQFIYGFYWIYFIFEFSALNEVASLIALLFFAVVQASFLALCLFFAFRFFSIDPLKKLLIVLPMVWVASEWLRSSVMFGTPWSMLGYTQTDTPLSGYAPVLGVFGISYLVAFCSALLASIVDFPKLRRKILTAIAGILIVGWGLNYISWSHPLGNQLHISLIQGNITHHKWAKNARQNTLDLYKNMILAERNSNIIILPETAIPDTLNHVSDYLNSLRLQAEQQHSEVLIGVLDGDIAKGSYYNAMINLKGDQYNKRHLIPFGEYFPIPGLPAWLKEKLEFSMDGFIPGEETQNLVKIAGREIGSTICYEIAYPYEVLKSMPAASLLVNISNDALFRNSTEPYLHHQISRMRAMETRRYVVRSSNTGITAIINPFGDNIASSLINEQTVIRGTVQPLSGATPYVLWGEKPLYFLFVIFMLFLILQNKRHAVTDIIRPLKNNGALRKTMKNN